LRKAKGVTHHQPIHTLVHTPSIHGTTSHNTPIPKTFTFHLWHLSLGRQSTLSRQFSDSLEPLLASAVEPSSQLFLRLLTLPSLHPKTTSTTLVHTAPRNYLERVAFVFGYANSDSLLAARLNRVASTAELRYKYSFLDNQPPSTNNYQKTLVQVSPKTLSSTHGICFWVCKQVFIRQHAFRFNNKSSLIVQGDKLANHEQHVRHFVATSLDIVFISWHLSLGFADNSVCNSSLSASTNASTHTLWLPTCQHARHLIIHVRTTLRYCICRRANCV
jgi:hypothetical protein